jgi:hypothetical protein
VSKFLEIIGEKGRSEFIRKAHITGIVTRESYSGPAHVEVVTLNGGVWRQEYSSINSAMVAADEMLIELEADK